MNCAPDVAVILLAGGTGTRMQSVLPKQYLPLREKPIARHSFDLFVALPEVQELIVVCDPAYQHYFDPSYPFVRFAPPGVRRQDSVWNGLQELTTDAPYICIHDAARPLITREMVQRVLEAARKHGAASAGIPLKYTIKECCSEGFVSKTPDRALYWEAQTPQIVRRELLEEGFKQVQTQNADVTDDISIVELLSHPAQMVEGSSANIKITTPEDLLMAEHLWKPL